MSTPLSFAVIGHPVAHSRSPQIHAAFARQFGIDLTYDRIDAEPSEFESTVEAFFNEGGSGLNVTVPFKERAWQMAAANLMHALRTRAPLTRYGSTTGSYMAAIPMALGWSRTSDA